ncbi:MAG TPA: J domain-containing protein, partial [Polyangiaceae bacterium]
MPRHRTDCDVRSLPITPRDAFLLSRVDGSANELDLAAMTGTDLESVRSGVDRLVSLGALEVTGGEAPRPPPSPRSQDPTGQVGRRTSQTQMKSIADTARELDEPTDLDSERKRKVLDLFASLDRDFYALLGIAPTAEKREVRRAYYAIGPDFHPDKFYGKNLGSFKAKMEAIFAQVTYAYETLSSAERRAEYDAYLALQRETRSMEELLSQAPVRPAGGFESAAARVAAPIAEEKPPASMRTPAASASMREAPRASTDSTPPRSAEDERARRLALARKLGVSRGSVSSVPPESRHHSNPPPSSGGSAAAAAAAAQELKRLRDASVDQGRRSQIRKYVESAEAQLKDNPAAAANAYRLALTMDPTNPDIIR